MASNTLELIFSSKNKSIEMNKKAEFRVATIDGIEASEYSISRINSNQDGAIITHRKIEPREITITGDIKKNENEDINRQRLISFFNPKFDGVLRIKRNNNVKKISYAVSSFRFTNSKMSEWLQFEIVLECANPYFESIDDYGKNIASITKQFTFPLVILEGAGKIMGYKTYSNEAVLVNDGDFETGCKINIKAASGVVTNPIIKLNDKYIKVNVSMNLDDVLSIDTSPRNKSIKLNGTNIMQNIDRASTFFNLDIGDNIITYSCDEGYENMEVNVYFTKKYAGV